MLAGVAAEDGEAVSRGTALLMGLSPAPRPPGPVPTALEASAEAHVPTPPRVPSPLRQLEDESEAVWNQRVTVSASTAPSRVRPVPAGPAALAPAPRPAPWPPRALHGPNHNPPEITRSPKTISGGALVGGGAMSERSFFLVLVTCAVAFLVGVTAGMSAWWEWCHTGELGVVALRQQTAWLLPALMAMAAISSLMLDRRRNEAGESGATAVGFWAPGGDDELELDWEEDDDE